MDQECSNKEYKKIVAIGSSAGGFAAILFGTILKLQKIIAFNPQTIISESNENENKLKWKNENNE